MDKYEYKVRADEIKELIAQGDYAQAAEIADTIDWRRVKSVMMLCTISDLYKINRRYEDARDMLLLAYERRPGGRTICYSLCELSIKMEEYVQAVEYYKEYVQVAPKDSGRYILQYKLYEAQDVSLEERIEVLEELKKRDYREKWAYELAYLYHRVGLATRCVEECDEMILWFGDGKYVIKAMELKMLHQPLTPEQQEKYDGRFGTKTAYSAPQPKTQAEVPVRRAEVQYVPEQLDSDSTMGDTKIYTPVNMEMLLAGEMAQGVPAEQVQVEEILADDTAASEAPAEDEMDIHVKTVDVGQYNTMNLQAEIAAGLREVLGEDNQGITNDPITNAILAPMMESDTESLGYQQSEEVSESSEVFFGETGEIGDLGLTTMLPVQEVSDDTAEIVMEQMRLEEIGAESEEDKTAELPKEMADVLTQGADGQISLVVPETENVEKQITGQMCIEDILAEWERMKLENEEKRKEEVRKHVLQQTGTMFTEFEAAVRDGLLEQLESGKIESVVEAEQAAYAAMNSLEPVEEIEEIAEVDFREEDFSEELIEALVDDEFEEDIEEDLEVEDLEIQDLTTEEATEESVAEDSAEEEFAEEVVEEEPAEEVVEEAVVEAVTEAESATEEPVAEETAEEVVEEAVVETVTEAEEAAAEETVAEEPVAEEAAEEAAEEPAEEPAAEEAVTEAPAAEAPAEEKTAEDTKTEEEESAEDEALKEKLLNNAASVPEVEDLNPAEDRPAVERDKAKIRALTRDEKELYATFIQSKSAREQLVQAIDNISLAAYTGNVIITGEEGMDTLTLAKNMVREVQASDSNFSGKVAKISGSALNNRDAAAIVRDLENGALIIQKAADMTSKTAAVLYKALQQDTMGIVVVLEDTKRAMNHFLSEHVNLSKCFTARMDVEALSNDTLVAFGRQYAREMEYAIDEMGMLALHTRIADMQTSDHVVTVVEVKKIVDEAIFNANKKTVGHFFDVLLAKRYDDEDMIVLGEKDFT